MYAWIHSSESLWKQIWINWKSITQTSDQIQYLRRLVNEFAPFIDFSFFSADIHLFTWSYGKNHIWLLMHLMVKKKWYNYTMCVYVCVNGKGCMCNCLLGFCNCSACEILAAIFPTSSKPNPALFCTISYFLFPRCDELNIFKWTVKQPYKQQLRKRDVAFWGRQESNSVILGLYPWVQCF